MIRAIAVDYDRTLTDETLLPSPDAIESLRRARERGVRVVVASGRPFPFLRDVADLGRQADAIVAENGGLLSLSPHGSRQAFDGGGIAAAIRLALSRSPVGEALEFGEVVVSGPRKAAPAAEVALAASGVPYAIELNADGFMALPPGVHKGTGLLRALDALGVEPALAAAIGDGENDVAMMRVVGFPAAVANGHPALLAVARTVARESFGRGTAEIVHRLLRGNAD